MFYFSALSLSTKNESNVSSDAEIKQISYLPFVIVIGIILYRPNDGEKKSDCFRCVCVFQCPSDVQEMMSFIFRCNFNDLSTVNFSSSLALLRARSISLSLSLLHFAYPFIFIKGHIFRIQNGNRNTCLAC